MKTTTWPRTGIERVKGLINWSVMLFMTQFPFQVLFVYILI